MIDAQEQQENRRKVVGTPFPKGVSGNPGGRKKGSKSIKTMVREYLDEHPEQVDKIIWHFVNNNRELMWQMLEGKPRGDDKLEVGIPQNIIDLIKNARESGDNNISEQNKE